MAAVILVRAVVGGMGKRIGEGAREGALDGAPLARVCVCVCVCVYVCVCAEQQVGVEMGKTRSGRSLGGALCPTLNGQDEHAACPSATCGGVCEPHLDSYLMEP